VGIRAAPGHASCGMGLPLRDKISGSPYTTCKEMFWRRPALRAGRRLSTGPPPAAGGRRPPQNTTTSHSETLCLQDLVLAQRGPPSPARQHSSTTSLPLRVITNFVGARFLNPKSYLLLPAPPRSQHKAQPSQDQHRASCWRYHRSALHTA
jgi:hypothetical protein